jgi:signal transduction histidine kinase
VIPPRPLSSLRNRIFLAGGLVAVLSVAVAIQLVTRRVGADAEADLQRGLDRAVRLVDRNHASRLESLFAEARLIADLPTLKAAVATADPPTVRPLAEDTRARVRADFLDLADAQGRNLASLGETREPVEREAVARALGGGEVTTYRAAERGVLEIITVPITVGPAPREILGTLSLGLLLDSALAQQFKEVTDSEVAFALAGRVRASTLPAATGERLASVLARDDQGTVDLDGNEFVTRSLRLASDAGPRALILRSRTERMQLLRGFRAVLLGASLVGVLVAVGLSYAVARTVTRPLADLTRVMREMTATGDLARRIAVPGVWGDEDAAVLARTFNALTEAIHRFQREAALRERLSALGRLSTVIAHEVRNPLMIIKSSLATLRREGTTPAEAREVAADIDGEVARLGRLVDGVLDYARPLRLELAPVDLGELCREAAAGVLSMAGAPAHLVEVEPALPPVVTDAERLRAVLVNVIANAREAAAARTSPPAVAGPDVVVRVFAQEGRALVVVADRGEGIPPADLPHLFEPYFTTKRTGTGLGLAIARNIMDALGGSITVSSVRGEGTEVRIELPFRVAAAAVPA